MAENWLENLKVGDPVFVSQKFGDPILRKVYKITKTQIVVGSENITGRVEERFRRASGWNIGSDRWRHELLMEPTPERYEQREIAHLKGKAEKLRESIKMPETKDELKKLIEALTPFQKEVPNG